MNKRVIGIAAGLAGAVALVLGLFSKHWVIGAEFGIQSHVGLNATELCQKVQPDLAEPAEESCSIVDHTDIAQSAFKPDGFETFSLVSRITLYTGLAAAGVMVLVIGLAGARKFPHLVMSPPSLGILLNVGTIVLIAITLSIHPWKQFGWGTGYSVLLAGCGATACLFGAILLGRLRPPVRDDW